MSRVGLVPSLVLLAALLGGCAALPQFLRPGGEALARADRLADAGDYEAALAAYDDYLTGHADAGEAPRARTSRLPARVGRRKPLPPRSTRFRPRQPRHRRQPPNRKRRPNERSRRV